MILGTPHGYRGEGVIPRFWKMVEHFGINFFSGVPTVYAALLQNECESHDLSSLRYAMCGAAPMPAELFREFERRTGLKILEGYGLTEGACVSSVNPPHGERRIGSIGIRIAYQNMRAVVLNDSGEYLRDAQAQVALEVDRNLLNIQDLSTQTAAGANQTSASSQELSRLAVSFNALVAQFKL